MGLPSGVKQRLLLSLIWGLLVKTAVLISAPELTPSVFSMTPPPLKSQILYLMHKGETSHALELYQEYYETDGDHDFELLHQLSLTLLKEGYENKDPETKLLSIFGAGISMDEKVLPLLEDGLKSQYPQLQLISLNFLARQQHDAADEALKRAMSSPFFLIRLEAVHYLALKKDPTATGQVEALMAKLPQEIKPVFPQIFATIGDATAMRCLRRLLHDPNEKVRIEAILSAAEFGRDDLLPQIRIIASHLSVAQQEACAMALGKMKDSGAVSKLQKLSQSPNLNVRLAAWYALITLGQETARPHLENAAKEGNPFAINLLGEVKGSEDVLAVLVDHPHLQVRVNATFALLERRDPRCLPGLYEILIHDARDLGIVRIFSVGRALKAWKVVPSAQEHFKDNPVEYELGVAARESALHKALDLPEIAFLQIAHTIFETQQNELVPSLVQLLENLRTPSAIDLLKKHQQKVGAPLIRNYCNLALYRMKITGPYAENLENWVNQQHHVELIRFRPFVPLELRVNESSYQLTPEETSKLFVDSIEALAKSQEEQGIRVLLNAIQHGNQKNKYALAGLLIRAAQ